MLWVPARRGAAVAAALAVVAVAATTFLAAVPIPLALLRLYARRDRYSILMVGGLLLMLAANLTVLAVGWTARPVILPSRWDPVWAVSTVVDWALPHALFGYRISGNGAQAVDPSWLVWVAWPIVVLILLLAVTRQTRPQWKLAAVLGTTALALVGATIMQYGGTELRYVIASELMLFAALAALLLPRPLVSGGYRRRHLLVLALLVALSAGLVLVMAASYRTTGPESQPRLVVHRRGPGPGRLRHGDHRRRLRLPPHRRGDPGSARHPTAEHPAAGLPRSHPLHPPPPLIRLGFGAAGVRASSWVRGGLDGFDAVAGAGFADGAGQVVADCALGQVQPAGDVGDGGAVGGRGRTSRSRSVSGSGPADRAAAARAGSTTRSPASTSADGGGEFLDRRILDQEATGAGFHGSAQIAGAAERGENDDAATGQGIAQLGGRGEAGGAGHLDVEQGHVWLAGHGRGHHLVAGRHLGDDVHVRFEAE